MRPLEDIEREIDALAAASAPAEAAGRLLALAEEALEGWVAARGEAPTAARREGFRLLALHRQGAEGLPSFNACRETCREIAWHYNVIGAGVGEPGRDLAMMAMLVRHLALFVAGKLQEAGVGEFCCASRPVRRGEATID